MNSFYNYCMSFTFSSFSFNFIQYLLKKSLYSFIIVYIFRKFVRHKGDDSMNYVKIAALIPFYDTNGENSTCILYSDGSKDYKPCSTKRYIHQMLYTLHLDPNALKHWTYNIIGTKLNTPIIIDNSLIFLPVKLRKGIGKQDGCFGYINHSFISSFEDNLVTLCNGETLLTLSPKAYIQKKQLDAKLLSYAYIDYKKQYEFMWK